MPITGTETRSNLPAALSLISLCSLWHPHSLHSFMLYSCSEWLSAERRRAAAPPSVLHSFTVKGFNSVITTQCVVVWAPQQDSRSTLESHIQKNSEKGKDPTWPKKTENVCLTFWQLMEQQALNKMLNISFSFCDRAVKEELSIYPKKTILASKGYTPQLYIDTELMSRCRH